jgi:thiol-disulfide isomerase/thioredoxin
LTVRNSMMGAMFLVSNGTNITTFLPAFKRFTVRPAPQTLENLSLEMDGASPVCLPVISALLERDPYAALVKEATRVEYLGEEKRGDVACHRLQFTHKNFDCQAWISAGPKPLLLAVKPCLVKMATPDNRPPGLKAEVLLNLNGWELGCDIPDSQFALALPDDAMKSDTLLPGMEEPDNADSEENLADALHLKPAPAFKLPLLGGGTFDLAAQKGTNVVVLDFWASWCSPCRLALPVLEKTALAYKGKGVSFLSINQQESEQDIRDFLRNTGLKVTVALDSESDAAQLYKVAGIPQILVIDKAGIVRESIVGYSKTLEDELRVILDALTAPPPAAPATGPIP